MLEHHTLRPAGSQPRPTPWLLTASACSCAVCECVRRAVWQPVLSVRELCLMSEPNTT